MSHVKVCPDGHLSTFGRYRSPDPCRPETQVLFSRLTVGPTFVFRAVTSWTPLWSSKPPVRRSTSSLVIGDRIGTSEPAYTAVDEWRGYSRMPRPFRAALHGGRQVSHCRRLITCLQSRLHAGQPVFSKNPDSPILQSRHTAVNDSRLKSRVLTCFRAATMRSTDETPKWTLRVSSEPPIWRSTDDAGICGCQDHSEPPTWRSKKPLWSTNL